MRGPAVWAAEADELATTLDRPSAGLVARAVRARIDGEAAEPPEDWRARASAEARMLYDDLGRR